MTIETLKQKIAGVEIDPRTQFLANVEHVIAREIHGDVSGTLREKLLNARLDSVFERAKDALERGNYSLLDDITAGLANGLRAAMLYERQSGSLKPWSAADEIKNNATAFFAEHFNGNETSVIQTMLPTGRHIRKVTLRAIELDDGTVITRADVHRYVLSQRPKFGDTISDDKFLEQFFTSERALLEIENARAITEREQIRKQTTHQSGPPSIIGTPIEN